MRKVGSLLFLIFLMGFSVLVVRVERVEASGTIYIRADGSIDPPSAPISTADNITYTFMNNINESIVVEKDNIVINGEGHILQGKEDIFYEGISLSGRSNVTIKNVKIRSCGLCGIYLFKSSNNTITGNNIEGNFFGLVLENSSNNKILKNEIVDSEWGGMLIGYCLNNSVSENNITRNNKYGIGLGDSLNNSIYGNSIARNNDYGIYLENSQYNKAFGNEILANSQYGVGLWYSSNNNAVYENEIANNKWGSYLVGSKNSSISNNNITNNGEGIVLVSSANNSINGNTIIDNDSGIWLSDSLYNSIHENNVTNNEYGVQVQLSLNNTFYLNNFINNTQHILISPSGYGYANFWNKTYSIGGNYWDDFETRYPLVGNDFSGPNQDQLGPDSFWDEPYIIEESNQDNYPFTEVIPEFPSLIILSLFMIATLLAALVYRRKNISETKKKGRLSYS